MITQAVIPAAGNGTRLGPFTNAIAKELLPIGNQAVIKHGLDALKAAGITQACIVVSRKKHGFSDYLGSGKDFGMKLTYVVQDERRGLADAVLAAEHLIYGEFVVVLGDNFFTPKTFIRDILRFHRERGADATVGVAAVRDVTRHGIIEPDGERIRGMVEKPEKAMAASNLGAMGVYVFGPDIFDAIHRTEPGHLEEIQLTDSINVLIGSGKSVFFLKTPGIHIDVGTVEDLMMANKYYLENKELFDLSSSQETDPCTGILKSQT